MRRLEGAGEKSIWLMVAGFDLRVPHLGERTFCPPGKPPHTPSQPDPTGDSSSESFATSELCL